MNSKFLATLCVILIIIIIIILVRIWQYKCQMRAFIRLTQKRLDSESNHMITVEYFNKDILLLADTLNEYTALKKKAILEFKNEQKQLKNVIAGISHDFRTPLTAAKGYLQFVFKNNNLSLKDKEYLMIAMEKVNYLHQLSDEFFEISYLDAKSSNVDLQPLLLNKILAELILSQNEWIEKGNYKTNFIMPEKDIYILSNEHYLKRIIENIFTNLKKYVKTNIGVSLYIENESVKLIIRNDTFDSLELDIKRVFDPFYRENSRHSKGSGLGLYVVKSLAEQMNYQVSATYINNVFEVVLVMKKIDKFN